MNLIIDSTLSVTRDKEPQNHSSEDVSVPKRVAKSISPQREEKLLYMILFSTQSQQMLFMNVVTKIRAFGNLLHHVSNRCVVKLGGGVCKLY